MAGRARKKNTNDLHRSGFLIMFFILVILGSVIYFYRDKFFVMFNTEVTSSKNMIGTKPKEKSTEKKSDTHGIADLINLIEKKDKPAEKIQKSSTVNESAAKPEESSKKNESIDVEALKKSLKQEILAEMSREQAKKEQAEKIQAQANMEKKRDIPQKTVVETKPVQENPPVNKPKIVQQTKKDENKKSETVSVAKTSAVETTPKQVFKTGKIYFSKFDEATGLKLVTAYRKVEYGDAPLTETIKALLKGPTQAELDNNIITNVPPNTILRNVYVKNGIAYIDLTSSFANNPYGRESTVEQLKQIVYTATEFSSVRAVQFLINGEIKSYLGGEGVLINRPLSRNDFS